MALSDNVAVVALVVSLVALILTSAQLLQQLFGTAEGYRRCADSVIGFWARARHRKFNFTEFRFEVKYLTPHFAVQPTVPTNGLARSPYEDAYSLIQHPNCGLDIKTRNSKHSKDSDGDGAYSRTSSGSQSPKDSNAAELANDEDLLALVLKPKTELEVSWLHLIAEAHQTYCSFWVVKDSSHRTRSGATQKILKYGGIHQDQGVPASSGGSRPTEPTAARREWNWDFMPPDLLRPLATSTLNTIILLGLRLNMQWRILDLEKGVFLADGNGYSLSTVDSRGLGLTFRFSIDGEQTVKRKYVPSEAVDKLMFGIIPKCPELVHRDFPLVGRNRRIESWPPRSLLQDIGIDGPGDEIAKSPWQEPHNDLVILLSPFLALSGCPAMFNYSPVWTGDFVISPLHYFDGRLSFLDSLRELIEKAPDHKGMPILKKVMGIFEKLSVGDEGQWKYDFFNRWDHSILEGTNNDEEKLKLAQVCCDIFDWTTEYFHGIREGKQRKKLHYSTENKSSNLDDNNGQFDWRQPYEGRTRYVDLVAAHTIVSNQALQKVLPDFPRNIKNYPVDEKRRQRHSELIPWDRREMHIHVQYNIAREYVESFKSRGIEHLRWHGMTGSDEYFETAWWVLMLRGIVWDMSTSGDPNVSKEQRREGESVPSFCYDTTTPVWIT